MNAATSSAVMLFLAALLQSTSYLCNKLPEARRPAWYPRERFARTLFDFSWILLFAGGAGAAFRLNLWLGVFAAVLYFLVLPFLFQSTLARLMGFKNLRALINYIDHHP